MPIESTHPQYKQWAARQLKCRDAFEGEEAVKAKKATYLPKLSSHKSTVDPKYVAYLARASFYGATNRTVEGLTGLVMRKPAVVEVPTEMEEFLDDVTGTGIDIQEFIKVCLDEVLTTGRYGIQVDADEDGGGEPYFVGRRAEDIRNWKVRDSELTLAVFAEVEIVQVDEKDPYEVEERINYREIFLTSEDAQTEEPGGRLASRIWRLDPGKKEYVPGEVMIAATPTGFVDVVPFTFISTSSTSADISKPPLLDLVNVNFAHYRNSADLEHGRHLTGLPTPYVTGVDPNDTKEIPLGSEEAITLKDPAAKAGYMEFTGQGLTTLENGMKEKKEDMAVLGARILEVSKREAETAETTRLNKSGDTSTMISIATAVESAVTIALEQARDWRGLTGDVSVEINRDLLDEKLDPSMIAELLKLVQEGLISRDTFYLQLQKGELLPDNFDAEEEQTKIEQQAPDLQGEAEDLTPQQRRLELVKDDNGRTTGAVEVVS